MGAVAIIRVPTVISRQGAVRVVDEMPLNDVKRAGLENSASIIRTAFERVTPGSV